MSRDMAIDDARAGGAKKLKPACTREFHDIHIRVNRDFHEAFLIALKILRYKTLVEFYREKMREAIEEAERRTRLFKVEQKEASG